MMARNEDGTIAHAFVQAPPMVNDDGTSKDGSAPQMAEASLGAVEERLGAIKNIQFKQGRAILEAATGGAMPNRFIVGDRNWKYQPMRNNEPYGDPEPWPMFIVEEAAGGCCSRDCWCRVCCNPAHPSVTGLYLSSGPIEGMSCCCNMCHTADYSIIDVNHPAPILAFERLGCCSRFANCFVCCEMCQDEMRYHQNLCASQGELDGTYADQAGDIDAKTVIAFGKVPIGGGGCTPTVNVFEVEPGQELKEEGLTPSFVVTGPTCFGGLYDWCCDTKFHVSGPDATPWAEITKKKPRDCTECCRAACSTADVYDLDFVGPEVSGKHKAMILGEMVHLDYMFFERDNFPIICEQDSNGNQWIHILCCLCYCYGCLCPIRVDIMIPSKQ